VGEKCRAENDFQDKFIHLFREFFSKFSWKDSSFGISGKENEFPAPGNRVRRDSFH
jgi:hypothetical protein